ncbi:MAG: 4'-phosphopantetheinyl transferase superfamily protein [Spirochaetales bacterium]|nr:4'-phosphopantetheinyl transferase superfamily protein [Spirochaetales bacterium]
MDVSLEIPKPLDGALPRYFSDINVYPVSHGEYIHAVTDLSRLLSKDEKLKAARYVFEKDRKRYTIVRAVLRRILAKQLHCGPEKIVFSYGPQGRPSLMDRENSLPVSFSVSHSGDYSLIAVSESLTVGIDLEHAGRITDIEALAKSFFSPREQDQWRGIAEEDRRDAFFRWWVQKEAFLKWSGQGITGGFSHFHADVAPGTDGGIFLDDGGDTPAVYVWEPFPGYRAAVCASSLSL